jgi:hypothetical protein
MMRNLITRLAVRWLQRRAHVVLDPMFMGIAVGNCTVVQQGVSYLVTPNHPVPRWVILNQSLVRLDEPIFVAADGKADGDGSKERPFATFQQAYEHAREHGA